MNRTCKKKTTKKKKKGDDEMSVNELKRQIINNQRERKKIDFVNNKQHNKNIMNNGYE